MTQSERNFLIRRMVFNSCRLFFLAHMGGYHDLNAYSSRVLLSHEPYHVYVDPKTKKMTIQNEHGQPDSTDGQIPPPKEYILSLLDELSADLKKLQDFLKKEGLQSSKRPDMMKRCEWNHLIAADQMIASYFSWPVLISDPDDANNWFV